MDIPFGAPPPMTVLPPGAKMQAAPEVRESSWRDFGDEMPEMGYQRLNPDAFQSWLDALPERRENIEDRRPPPPATEASVAEPSKPERTMEQLTPSERKLVLDRIRDVSMAFGGGKL